MKLYGVDFTSAPRPKKPITCMEGWLEGSVLHLVHLHRFTRMESFHSFLCQPDTWVAALDFPLSQPVVLLRNLGWPEDWATYVQRIAGMEMSAFESLLRDYRQNRPSGDKHHYRPTDILTHSSSPMMLYRVPVGKMFFKGAPLLLHSDVSVLPCRPLASSKIAVEGYPALVARYFIGKTSYKSDERSHQTPERGDARQRLWEGLLSPRLLSRYSVRIQPGALPPSLFIEDPTGDNLDALLCCIQAAWAYHNRDRYYGIPPTPQAQQGWIVDPSVVDGAE